MMEQFWRATGVALGKYWKIVAAVVVVLTILFGFGLRNLEFATGQDSYLNPESQIAEDNVIFQEAFGGETVILLFTATGDAEVPDLFEGENLVTLTEITEELAAIDEAYAVVTPLVSLEFADNLLSGGVGTRALTSAASRDDAHAAERNADLGIALGRLQAVPADDREIGVAAWNEVLIFGNDGYAEVDGEIVAPTGDDRAIRLSLASTFPETQDGSKFTTAVGGVVLQGNATLDEQTIGTEKVLDVLDGVSFEGFDVTVTGSPVYLAEINDYLKGGMLTLGLAALVVMAVILALIFRVRWRLLPLLAVIIGVVWAFSIVGLVGIDLSLVTIAGLPILIGLGIDFAIQIHNRVEEEVVLDRADHPISETVANLAPPLIAATITGVLAFLALQISKVPMIRDFGVLLAIGVVVLVVVGIVVPASALGIREWTKPTTERGPSVVERVVVWLGGLPTATGPFLIGLAVAVFVGGVLTEGQAKIESDPIKWIDQDSQVVKDINKLEDETGFSSTLGVLVQTNNIYDQDVVDLLFFFTEDAEGLIDDDGNAVVVSTSSLVNTMGKIIEVPDAAAIPPDSDDISGAAEVMPSAIGNALVGSEVAPIAPTQTQVNLRLAPSSLDERAVFVDELQDMLDARIAELDLDPDSVLLVDLPEGQDPVRATPAGLATVGIGLLDNLSANRANLTYLALCLAGLYLVLRLRSLSRALLALVPVAMAVGLSSMVVGLAGLTLSPLTTVSGPLVIATCAEFSVLILGRYLEERQRGLDPRASSDKAAARTGRAFFTSALTTIGGFAVLIGSALPLLSDFGIIVTLNVAIALLAALVVMPPLSVWVDRRGWLGTQEQTAPATASVRLAAVFPGAQTIGMAVGVVAAVVGAVVVYSTADTGDGEAVEVAYAAVPLPTTTTTTTTTTMPPPTTTIAGETVPDGPLIDPSGFPTERPESFVSGVLFDLLTDNGVEPNVANCAITTLFTRITEEELLTMVGPPLEQAAVDLVTQASLDCGIDQETIDAAIADFNGE
ncbi:MAG: MMPL family transporter [Acidimicrobiia bacterium]|nr:MMPL family transporter [Acidimicrobiia bacterium]